MASTRFGPYELLERLGRGAAGEVFRARDTRTGAEVALKVLDRARADEAFVRRFEREATVARSVVHPNVTRVLDAGVVAGAPYVALELARGGTLRQRLDAGARPDWREAALLGAQVASALDAVHAAGLVHRDLKPENLLLNERGQLLLTDFGLARAEGRTSLTGTHELLGTPEYMSPEQCEGGGAIDGRADLYALGVLLHELFAGERPFAGSPLALAKQHLTAPPPRLSARAPRVPDEASALVLALLAKSPAGRPKSARDVARELERIAKLPERAASSPVRSLALAAALLAVPAVVLSAALAAGGRSPGPVSPTASAKPSPTRTPAPSPASKATPTPAPSLEAQDDVDEHLPELAELDLGPPERSAAWTLFQEYWAVQVDTRATPDNGNRRRRDELAAEVLAKDRLLPERLLATGRLGDISRAGPLLTRRQQLDEPFPLRAWKDAQRYLAHVESENAPMLLARGQSAFQVSARPGRDEARWIELARASLADAVEIAAAKPDPECEALACVRLGAVLERKAALLNTRPEHAAAAREAYQLARAAYEKGLALGPTRVRFEILARFAAFALQRVPWASAEDVRLLEARLVEERELAQSPGERATCWLQLGQLLASRKDPDLARAEEAFGHAIELGPGLAADDARRRRADLRWKAGRLREAIADWDELIDRRPDGDPRFRVARMAALEALGDPRAVVDARTILDAGPRPGIEPKDLAFARRIVDGAK